MATSSTYYLNGPSLGSSTAVFLDAALTTLSPDGFYSDGIIVREQVGGVLLPQQTCDSCTIVHWSIIGPVGGKFTIYSNDLVTELLEVLTDGTFKTGTIYPTSAQLPYTIIGEYLSGGVENTSRYRICDVSTSTEIFFSGTINSVTPIVGYTVTPNLSESYIHFASGNITPSFCT